MEVDIYKSRKKNAYIFVPKGHSLPELKADAGPFDFLKTVEMTEEQPRIAVDVKEALRNIEEKGFHIGGVEIRFEEHVA